MANYLPNMGPNPGYSGNYPNQNGSYTNSNYPTGNAWGPSQPTSTLPFTGRYVGSLNDIRPNEIPMDGRVALFPTNSLDAIYLKSWGTDGLIKTFRYVLDTSADLNAQPMTARPNDDYQQMMRRLEQLEAAVKEGSKTNKSSSRTSQGEAKQQ